MMNIHPVLSLAVCFCFLYGQLQAFVIVKDPWDAHKLKYGLNFHEVEDKQRRLIFEDNLAYIEQINAANLTYKLAMNHLGHMSVDELMKGINAGALKKHFQSQSEYHIERNFKSSETEEATAIDWRLAGAVSPVKNQGRCGSCWSFSTTGAIEGQYKLKYGNMKLFSEQQLVDCDNENVDHGCEGGLPVAAFEYARETGLLTESDYPYNGSDNECRLKFIEPSRRNFTKIRGYTVLGMDEKELTSALYKIGPISIAIDASGRDFQFYSSGVYYNSRCGSNMHHLNHAVLAVGYGHDRLAGKDFYIVKNSWSERWGDGGYIKMARNMDNNCGVATFATYPMF